MRERPILFSAPMIRALLAGTKTQTRRVLKVQPPLSTTSVAAYHHPDDCDGRPRFWSLGPDPETHGATDRLQPDWAYPCPYGRPGERLWVRETHAPQPDCSLSWEKWMRGAGGEKPIIHYAADATERTWVERWRPSIHMPRWASRISLEVTGVRAERLQDISEEDAKDEGAWGPDASIVSKVAEYFGCSIYAAHPSLAYRMLWEQIHGADSWAANPWVWVIEFGRARP
ncbi:hypothetical protein [Variovorax atrisoli]|uniref:hypothetical protein n=1 Tax=Variovorax atrisoli TaxID=3394203 RepID=UPI0040400868